MLCSLLFSGFSFYRVCSDFVKEKKKQQQQQTTDKLFHSLCFSHWIMSFSLYFWFVVVLFFVVWQKVTKSLVYYFVMLRSSCVYVPLETSAFITHTFLHTQTHVHVVYRVSSTQKEAKCLLPITNCHFITKQALVDYSIYINTHSHFSGESHDEVNPLYMCVLRFFRVVTLIQINSILFRWL